MTGRRLTTVAAAVVAVLVSCTGLIGAATGGQGADACAPPDAATSSTGPSVALTPSGGHPRIGQWDPSQVGNAATIIAVGTQRGVPPRGWVVAIATAMQESSLRNLPGGDRDSIGLFQQRPSQGWGSPAQLLDPVYAANAFYTKLVTVPRWQTLPLTQAAQAVQNSATPGAYTRWENDARTLVEQLTGAGTAHSCDATIGPQGWVAPVHAPIGSGFRTPARPTHNGVDLTAARGTPIRAAAAGTVTAATCNVRPASHGCDQDGNPSIKGCGWMLDITHQAGTATRYCHLLHRPTVRTGQTVAAGQVIGAVGSSGNSSGAHLHFEVLLHGAPVDPVPWMQARAAPLGRPT